MATSMLATTSERIFQKGLDAKNTEIGKYTIPYVKERVKEGYSPSRKVILQNTRQMVNDFSVITGKESVGLGFKNQFNADKSGYVEDTYNAEIFKHTESEEDLAIKLFNTEVKKIING